MEDFKREWKRKNLSSGIVRARRHRENTVFDKERESCQPNILREC